MAPKTKQPKKFEFPEFTKAMTAALKLGQVHRDEGRQPAAPLELVTTLKLAGVVAPAQMLNLREAYLAGFNFPRF